VDIEREVKLGGAIHSKGVLILSSYLASRFAHDQPLSLSASLAFEQSYEPVEGDSASVAELCALLSALSRIPLHQELAVTGSVNQQGEVQAIGGVNEKIEGFFDICRARGLNGKHGVIIPEANRKHLMLRRDVVEAVRDGRFHVYAVAHADAAMEVLTGMPAGSPDAAGEFPEDTVNGRVQCRLRELSRLQQRYRRAERKQDDEHNDAD
jgi:predicted ATP-dependent protease